MLPSFSRIIEQEKAKEMLRRALGGNKLAHAYLFRGPGGVGKKSAARALAARLNCSGATGDKSPPAAIEATVPTGGGISLEACGRCPSCLKFASGNHPDFLQILPSGAAIKIDQVREVKKALSYPPLEGGFRVVLLAEVHTMRREAANSMLKTLEEPPEKSIFILTGDETGGILPTIISRCQVVPFFPLSHQGLAAMLTGETELDPRAALTLAAVAEGSLGRARMLLERDLLTLRRRVFAMLTERREQEPEVIPMVMGLAEECAELKEQLPDFLDLLASCFHDLAIWGADAEGEPPPFAINRDMMDLLTLGARRWPPAALDRRLHSFRRAKSQLKRNCNRSMVCEVLFFDLF